MNLFSTISNVFDSVALVDSTADSRFKPYLYSVQRNLEPLCFAYDNIQQLIAIGQEDGIILIAHNYTKKLDASMVTLLFFQEKHLIAVTPSTVLIYTLTDFLLKFSINIKATHAVMTESSWLLLAIEKAVVAIDITTTKQSRHVIPLEFQPTLLDLNRQDPNLLLVSSKSSVSVWDLSTCKEIYSVDVESATCIKWLNSQVFAVLAGDRISFWTTKTSWIDSLKKKKTPISTKQLEKITKFQIVDNIMLTYGTRLQKFSIDSNFGLDAITEATFETRDVLLIHDKLLLASDSRLMCVDFEFSEIPLYGPLNPIQFLNFNIFRGNFSFVQNLQAFDQSNLIQGGNVTYAKSYNILAFAQKDKIHLYNITPLAPEHLLEFTCPFDNITYIGLNTLEKTLLVTSGKDLILYNFEVPIEEDLDDLMAKLDSTIDKVVEDSKAISNYAKKPGPNLMDELDYACDKVLENSKEISSFNKSKEPESDANAQSSKESLAGKSEMIRKSSLEAIWEDQAKILKNEKEAVVSEMQKAKSKSQSIESKIQLFFEEKVEQEDYEDLACERIHQYQSPFNPYLKLTAPGNIRKAIYLADKNIISMITETDIIFADNFGHVIYKHSYKATCMESLNDQVVVLGDDLIIFDLSNSIHYEVVHHGNTAVALNIMENNIVCIYLQSISIYDGKTGKVNSREFEFTITAGGVQLKPEPIILVINNFCKLVAYNTKNLASLWSMNLDFANPSRLPSAKISDEFVCFWNSADEWIAYSLIDREDMLKVSAYDHYRLYQHNKQNGVATDFARSRQMDSIFASKTNLSLGNVDKKDELELAQEFNPKLQQLNERGEKLEELNVKFGKLNDSSKSFLTAVKALNEKESKKKWWKI